MKERRISQEQYRKAREIVDLAQKQAEEWRLNHLLPIIKKYTETYWKKQDDSAEGHYYYIKQNDNHTVHIISFRSLKNGIVVITKHWLDGGRINEFLGKIVKRTGIERMDLAKFNKKVGQTSFLESTTCNCPQLDHLHYTEQHNPLKRITRKNFMKYVQADVLSELKIGLKF
jgi:hypothetical protein